MVECKPRKDVKSRKKSSKSCPEHVEGACFEPSTLLRAKGNTCEKRELRTLMHRLTWQFNPTSRLTPGSRDLAVSRIARACLSASARLSYINEDRYKDFAERYDWKLGEETNERMKKDALVLWDRVANSGQFPNWLEFNALIEYMVSVGKSYGMNIKIWVMW